MPKRSQKSMIAETMTPTTLQVEPTLSTQQLNEQDIIRIVENELAKHLSTIKEISHNEFELVPKPKTIKGKTKGRKEDRKYYNLSVAIDANLSVLFHEECEKYNIPKSRLLDSILFNHYKNKHPKLTYGNDANE
jgi:hypothetical protein